jgi:hypothetical protein
VAYQTLPLGKKKNILKAKMVEIGVEHGTFWFQKDFFTITIHELLCNSEAFIYIYIIIVNKYVYILNKSKIFGAGRGPTRPKPSSAPASNCVLKKRKEQLNCISKE